jgi:hypothetical protein
LEILIVAQDPALLPTFPESRNVADSNQLSALFASDGRSTQKRGFVFDAEEVTATQGGLVKKYRKG